MEGKKLKTFRRFQFSAVVQNRVILKCHCFDRLNNLLSIAKNLILFNMLL